MKKKIIYYIIGILGCIIIDASFVATAIYHEIIGLIGSSKRNRTRLVHKLKDLTDPNAIEDANMLAAWKRFYENKITVRTKYIWSRRLLRAIRTARQGLRAGREDSYGRECSHR